MAAVEVSEDVALHAGAWVRKQPLQPGSPYKWPGFPPLALDKPTLSSRSKTMCDQTASQDTGRTGQINNDCEQGEALCSTATSLNCRIVSYAVPLAMP